MKVILAARFSATVFLLTGLATFFAARTGIRVVGVLLPRQIWVVEHTGQWLAVNWLWLLAVFSWMVLLVALMWSYSPAHRISTMLQSGLLIIAATLLIIGIVIWMNLLPFGAGRDNAVDLIALVDALALSFLGAGFFMGGIVTAAIGIDLMRLQALPRVWLGPLVLAGICWLPSPFLLPRFDFLALGFVFWLAWCLILSTRRTLPNAYPEWT